MGECSAGSTDACERQTGVFVKGKEAVEDWGRATGGATRGAGLFTGSLGSLTNVLAGLGIVAAVNGRVSPLLRVLRVSKRFCERLRGSGTSLTALYGDAQIANTSLSGLAGIESAITWNYVRKSAVQGAVRLKTVGVEGARAEGVIREFGNAAALAGASSVELGRSLVGFTQILSRGKVSQEEINQILEAVPLIGVSIREAFGSIDAEVIRAQLDAAGQGVQDFTDILVNQLSMGARASADSTRNAFSNLENATFRLHTAIGDRLSPSVKEATGFLTELANSAADFVSGIDDATRSATSYADALMMASNAAAVNTAIQERIEFLRQEKVAHDEAAEGRRSYFRFRSRDTDAGTEYKEITKEIGELAAAFNNTAAAAEHFRNIQNQLISEARVITQEIIDLGEKGAKQTARALGRTSRAIRVQREALAETQKQIGENAVVLRVLASANTVVTVATEKTTEATKEATEATKAAAVEIITYAEAIRQVQANVAAYVEEQALLANFGDFWRVASGEAEGYSTAIDLTTASVVNLKNELDALTTVFNEQNIVINGRGVVLDAETQALLRYLATLDGLAESLDNVERRLDAHNVALANPAISDAVRSLRSYNDALSDAGVKFEDVGDISESLTDSIRDQASAFDDLRASIGGVSAESRRLPGELFDISDALDKLDTEVQPVGRGISNLELALESLGDNSGNVLDQLIGDFSNLDGVVGQLGTKIGQFDIAGLASGNPLSLATLPLQLYNAFTFDQRQADAQLPELGRQNRGSFERGEFGIPSDLLEFGRGQLDTAAGATGRIRFRRHDPYSNSWKG